jgi:hypothetical protein
MGGPTSSYTTAGIALGVFHTALHTEEVGALMIIVIMVIRE